MSNPAAIFNGTGTGDMELQSEREREIGRERGSIWAGYPQEITSHLGMYKVNIITHQSTETETQRHVFR